MILDIKNVSVNALLGVISKLVGLLLLPFILALIDAEEYGKFGILLVLLLWIEKTSAGPFTNGLARWFNISNLPKDEFKSLSSKGFLYSLAISFIFSLVFAKMYVVDLTIIIPLVFSTIIYSHIESFIRFQRFHRKAAILLSIRSFLIPICQLLFLNVFEKNFTSLIIPYIVSNSIYILLGYKYWFPFITLKFNDTRSDIKSLLGYSIPLVLIGILNSGYQLYDRYVLELLGSLKDVASLTFSWQIGGIIAIGIATPIKQVILPEFLGLENQYLVLKKRRFQNYALTAILSITTIGVVKLAFPIITRYFLSGSDIYFNENLTLGILVFHYFSTIVIFYRIGFFLSMQSKLISIIQGIPVLICFILLPLFLERIGIVIIALLYIVIALVPIFTYRLIEPKDKGYSIPRGFIFIELLSLALLTMIYLL